MQWQIDTFGPCRFRMQTFAEAGPNAIIGSAEWLDDYGGREERHAVLTIRDGKIADMQVFATRRAASRAAARA